MWLNKNYFGKLLALLLAFSIQMPLQGAFLVVAIGHLVDIRWEYIKNYLQKRNEYQKTTEDFILLVAYYCYVMRLDANAAANCLVDEVITKDEKQVQDLFKYYVNVYIPKKFNKSKDFEKEIIKAKDLFLKGSNLDDGIKFFNIIETIFDNQIKNASATDIDILKQIASEFNIDYQRSYRYNNGNQNHYTKYNHDNEKEYYKEQKNSYSSKEYGEQKSYQNEQFKTKDTTIIISTEVKEAFSLLGFNVNKLPTLVQLKQTYKEQAKKYHPDLNNSDELSAQKIAELNKKLANLNKAMDIAKKFLANK